MEALVVVLLLAIAVVRWWPTWTGSPSPGPFRDRPADRIQIQEITPTRQSQELNPPPPAPLPPVVVPNDVLVKEEVSIGESPLQVETTGNDERFQEGTRHATAGQQPDTDARLLRNVQPNYPTAARKDGVRARIEVEVTVKRNGRVQNARVRRRWLLSDEGASRPVTNLGYGLEEAALAAAQRSLFRPATANGRRVSTQTVITFTFGPQ